MRGGIIKISTELLAAALKLPPGTRITGASDQLYFNEDVIALSVEHPDLFHILEGCVMMNVTPVYRTERRKCGCWEAFFERWNSGSIGSIYEEIIRDGIALSDCDPPQLVVKTDDIR